MMKRSLQQRLGFEAHDRVVVLHVDDVGMCEATMAAYRDLVARPTVSSASTMVPCAWFPAVAGLCRERPELDLGIHLTLNSEWTDYRWAPVLGAAVSSLTDELGYFRRHAVETHEHARAEEAARELRAQIARATSAGIDVTHLDSHMFTLRHPALLGVYLDLAREHGLPCGVVRTPDPEIARAGFPKAVVEAYERQLAEAEEQGLPLFAAWVDLPLGDFSRPRLELARRLVDGLPEGLSAVLFHPAVDCPELRAIAFDWPGRVGDYELLRDDAWARALEEAGVGIVGMRAVRTAMADL